MKVVRYLLLGYQIHVNSPNLVLFLEQIIKTLIKDKLKSLLIIE